MSGYGVRDNSPSDSWSIKAIERLVCQTDSHSSPSFLSIIFCSCNDELICSADLLFLSPIILSAAFLLRFCCACTSCLCLCECVIDCSLKEERDKSPAGHRDACTHRIFWAAEYKFRIKLTRLCRIWWHTGIRHPNRSCRLVQSIHRQQQD